VDGTAVRFRIQANLDGRRFETFAVDIGFDEPGPLEPDVLQRDAFLAFAGVVSPLLPTIPIEIHLAEKRHAYARIYTGGNSTRVKDLVDMVLIGTTQTLSAGRCRLALRHTFSSRGVQHLPGHRAPPPAAWAVPHATLAKTVSLDPDMAAGHASAALLFDPLLDGTVRDDAEWGAARWAWQ